MSLILPKPSGQYDPGNEAAARAALEQADARTMKTGGVFASIKLRDTVTGAVKTLTIANGVVVIT